MQQDKIRIDKFLWAVRLFKTRTEATDACHAGKVKIKDASVKPSKEVVIGDAVSVVLHSGLHKTFLIKELISSRIGAPLVAEYIEDQTPAEEYERILLLHKMQALQRERGAGRPTKKERRELDKWASKEKTIKTLKK
jgi:ribosome-associated heat shock protein Hsp15